MIDGLGRYRNVRLTESEMEELEKELPNYRNYIERLSCYMKSTGKKYKSHAATIWLWANEDSKKAEKTYEQGDAL